MIWLTGAACLCIGWTLIARALGWEAALGASLVWLGGQWMRDARRP